MQQLPAPNAQVPGAHPATLAPGMTPGPSVGRRRRTWYVILILCLFAAIIPETLTTTSTSVAKILTQPLSLPFLMLFYGLADLLIREALVRRHLGWGSLVLLGIAFGFFNEGVVAGTWYPGKYEGATYIGQISFEVAAGLAVFHLFISVITPIAFVETLFPAHAGMPLLRRRGIVLSAVIFLLLTALVGFAPAYRPYRLGVFALALLLAAIALLLPPAHPRTVSAAPPPRLRRLWWWGFFGSVILYLMILIVPQIIQKLAGHHILVAQAATVAILALYAAVMLRIGRRWTARLGWSPRHTLALISGVLAFPALFTLLPPLWPTLEPVATVPFLALLLWLNVRLARQQQALHGLALDATDRSSPPQASGL